MKIKFGCIYQGISRHSCNEQQYGYYIPVCWVDKEGKEHWRMVDTYMVQPSSVVKTLEERQKFLLEANKGETSHCTYWGPRQYYYQNYMQLDSDELNENCWEVVIDLLQCEKIVPESEVDDYDTADITEKIPMYWEDSYNWYTGPGNYYLKPGKQKSINAITLKLSNKLNDESYISNSSYYIHEYYEPLSKYVSENNLDPDIKRLAGIALEKFDAYKKAMDNLQKEYDEITDKYKKLTK